MERGSGNRYLPRHLRELPVPGRMAPAEASIVLAGCADNPTSPDRHAAAEAPGVRTVPTGRPSGCPEFTTGAEGTLPGSGAFFLICVPPGFDPATGSLVVYAPGSVPPQLPLAIRDDEVGGVPVSQIVTGVLGNQSTNSLAASSPRTSYTRSSFSGEGRIVRTGASRWIATAEAGG